MVSLLNVSGPLPPSRCGVRASPCSSQVPGPARVPWLVRSLNSCTKLPGWVVSVAPASSVRRRATRYWPAFTTGWGSTSPGMRTSVSPPGTMPASQLRQLSVSAVPAVAFQMATAGRATFCAARVATLSGDWYVTCAKARWPA